jgi:hypothetical protein
MYHRRYCSEILSVMVGLASISASAFASEPQGRVWVGKPGNEVRSVVSIPLEIEETDLISINGVTVEPASCPPAAFRIDGKNLEVKLEKSCRPLSVTVRGATYSAEKVQYPDNPRARTKGRVFWAPMLPSDAQNMFRESSRAWYPLVAQTPQGNLYSEEVSGNQSVGPDGTQQNQVVMRNMNSRNSTANFYTAYVGANARVINQMHVTQAQLVVMVKMVEGKGYIDGREIKMDGTAPVMGTKGEFFLKTGEPLPVESIKDVEVRQLGTPNTSAVSPPGAPGTPALPAAPVPTASQKIANDPAVVARIPKCGAPPDGKVCILPRLWGWEKRQGCACYPPGHEGTVEYYHDLFPSMKSGGA